MFLNDESKWQPTVTPGGIYGFFGPYRFLSNFHPCKITYQGITYPSSEHLYMALKTTDVPTREFISTIPSAKEVKSYGQKVPLRPHWEQIKVVMMFKACTEKFSQNEDLKQLLLNTGNLYLEETNYWHDYTWGKSHADIDSRSKELPAGDLFVGSNLLGKVLMGVRTELRIVENDNRSKT